KQRALLLTGGGDDLTAANDLKRSEQPELEHLPVVTPRGSAYQAPLAAGWHGVRARLGRRRTVAAWPPTPLISPSAAHCCAPRPSPPSPRPRRRSPERPYPLPPPSTRRTSSTGTRSS